MNETYLRYGLQMTVAFLACAITFAVFHSLRDKTDAAFLMLPIGILASAGFLTAHHAPVSLAFVLWGGLFGVALPWLAVRYAAQRREQRKFEQKEREQWERVRREYDDEVNARVERYLQSQGLPRIENFLEMERKQSGRGDR